MIESIEIIENNAFSHVVPTWHIHDDIIMKLEEEEEEEAEEIEDLKEKQKRLKEEMIKKRRIKKDQNQNEEPR